MFYAVEHNVAARSVIVFGLIKAIVLNLVSGIVSL